MIARDLVLGMTLGLALAGCGGASGTQDATGGSGPSGTAGLGVAGSSTGGSVGAGGTGGPSGKGGSGPGSGGASSGSSGGTAGRSSGGAGDAAGASGAGAGGDAGGIGGRGGAAGSVVVGGRGGGAGSGGSAGRGSGGVAGNTNPGSCTASKPAGANATGSGPHKVTVEINSDPGINQGTIFRPTDLGGAEKYPILVWGEGACSKDGLSNAIAMAEIASHGYFVVADGTPNGTGNRAQDRSMLKAMAAPLIAYVDWAIAENGKPCSAYYQSLDTAHIAANGFSCGGLMSQAMVLDPRITTWGVNSSGMAGATQDYYAMIHTPVLFVEGGPDDIAYDGGGEGYAAIAKLNVPVIWFSKPLGHGGDLFATRGGDFTKIDIAWLNWWLKNDQTATGKGLLVGASCPYCSNAAWEHKSMNVP
jgi:dienelactone hydrolase